MNENIPITFRPLEPGDYNFVLNSWLESYREYVCGPKRRGDDLAPPINGPQRVTAQTYFDSHQRIIAKLSEVRRFVIGCDPEDTNFIIGWICGETYSYEGQSLEAVVDYVYVKSSYRRQGVASALLDHGLGWRGEPIIATHWTRAITPIAHKFRISYNDYLLKMGNF